MNKVWMTNIKDGSRELTKLRADCYEAGLVIVTDDPKASKTYSVAELKQQGMVGCYKFVSEENTQPTTKQIHELATSRENMAKLPEAE